MLSRGASFTPAPISFLPVPVWPRPQFDPELVLISAGFDSAIGDPEVRAWPVWGGLLGSRARPPPCLALVPGADVGHTGVLRPPHSAAAGAGWRPSLCCAGGDRDSWEGSPVRCGGAIRGACCTGRGVLPGMVTPRSSDTPAQAHVCPSPFSQGGYHLESLSQSVCMVVKALLGDPALPLSGPMEPCRRCGARRVGTAGAVTPGLTARLLPTVPWSPSRVSGLPRPLIGRASSSKVSVARAGRQGCFLGFQAVVLTLNYPLGSAPILSPSTCSPEGRASPVSPGGPKFKAAEAQASAALSSLLEQMYLNPTPPVRTAVALTALDAALVLPPGVLQQEGSAPREETRAWARWAEWAWGGGGG